MFCTKCGSIISDDAKFCPNCGEIVREVIDFSEETSILGNISDKELSIALEGNVRTIGAVPNAQKEFNIVVYNFSTNPIYDVEVEISDSHQIAIITQTQRFDTILPNTSQQASFIIVPKGPGNFKLTAKVQSKAGHSDTLPFEVRSSILAETLASTKPSYRRTRSSEMKGEWGVLIIILLFGIIMMIGGIFSIFQMPSIGITFIILGLLLIGIGTKGRCAYCFLACGDCDC